MLRQTGTAQHGGGHINQTDMGLTSVILRDTRTGQHQGHVGSFSVQRRFVPHASNALIVTMIAAKENVGIFLQAGFFKGRQNDADLLVNEIHQSVITGER